jgi:galactose mutarotase-like enzyme
MYTIGNEYIDVRVAAKGAELQSIFHKEKKLEYMWSGDPAIWGKKSPVLFPIVGTLKNDTYYFEGKAYQLSRHGFAREMEFHVTDHTADSITFTLTRTDATFENYPFQFRLDLIYTVKGHELHVKYCVINKGEINQPLYFSVGGHPAFRLPLLPGSAYHDYALVFNKRETAGRWMISPEGLIETSSTPLLDHTHRLPLNKALFQKDAIVLKHLHSNKVTLVEGEDNKIFEFDFTGFPYLGIWAAKNADFVCIEPWCGIADPVDTNQQLTEKEGILQLDSTDQFERTWKIRLC